MDGPECNQSNLVHHERARQVPQESEASGSENSQIELYDHNPLPFVSFCVTLSLSYQVAPRSVNSGEEIPSHDGTSAL
jgi:hypothetical protein